MQNWLASLAAVAIVSSVAAFGVVAWLPFLPSLTTIVALAGAWLVVAVVVFSLRHFSNAAVSPWQYVFGWLSLPLLCGLWAMGWGTWQLQYRLPLELEGVDLDISGTVEGPVVHHGNYQRFEFVVTQVRPPLNGKGRDSRHSHSKTSHLQNNAAIFDDEQWQALSRHFPRRLRLNIYRNKHGQMSTVHSGDGWRWTVRLKRPHGLASSGSFDYERWLFAQGIDATGYVRLGNEERLPALDRIDWRWREQVIDRIQQQLPVGMSAAIVQALALGDRTDISNDQRQLLQQSGLAHLVAISGLHIGLAAGVGVLLGGLLARTLSILWPLRIFASRWGLISGCVVAFAYAWAAGFSLSTQRALIMLLVATGWMLLLRRPSPWLGFAVAMLLVLLLQPLAIVDAGFWFSFVAVALLLLFLQQGEGWKNKLWLLVKLQLSLFVVMTFLQSFWGMPVSLLSPLLNLLAIPYVSFAVVPVVLLALLVSVLDLSWAQPLWWLAWWLCEGFVWCLQQLQPYLQASLIHIAAGHTLKGVWFGALAALLLMLPLPWRTRLLAGIALFSVSFARLAPSNLAPRVDVLDVGQGLAVMVSSNNEFMLYDTGPAFGDFSTFDAVVMPWLQTFQPQTLHSLQAPHPLQNQNTGQSQLHTVVISHWDWDHASGFGTLDQGGQVAHWWLSPGKRAKQPASGAYRWCQQDNQWLVGQWQVKAFGLEGSMAAQNDSNNQSCVVLLQAQDVRILLTGDIEHEREQELLNHPWLADGVDVLLAPHHGSKTSSSERFLKQLQPKQVLISSGYRNRYHHPHPTVLRRYHNKEIAVFNTAEEGTVTVLLGEGEQQYRIETYRKEHHRYWF